MSPIPIRAGVYSGWEHAEVVLRGESFAALAAGLQNALWQLGGVPAEHRRGVRGPPILIGAAPHAAPTASPPLSPTWNAAPALERAREDTRVRYEALCADYAMEPTRNNRGPSSRWGPLENGLIESRHGHLKTRLDQALQLRGARDFDTFDHWRPLATTGDDWRACIAQIVGRHNARRREALRIEAPQLRPLPPRRSCDFDAASVRVSSSGGFTLRKVFYTVPSRLIGPADRP